MTVTYKVLSAALSYPTAELQAAAPEMIAALDAERLVPLPQRAAVATLIADIAGRDLLDAQSDYVDLFDRTRALSLHMFEHVHGESRDRGQAMVSLRERYIDAGFDLASNELPDYVPLFLEFLSLQSPPDAQAMLSEPAHVLCALGERLKKRGSYYTAIFDALQALTTARLDAEALNELRKVELDDINDFEALDRAWEEAEVHFGPDDAGGAGACPRASDILRKMGPTAKAGSQT